MQALRASIHHQGIAAMSQDHLHDVREMDDADLRLIQFTRKLEEDSLDTLEAAARQIITLTTSLLGLFLGILAFKDTPDFLQLAEIKLLGIGALGLFLAALFFALNVVLPREFNPQDLDAMRAMIVDLLRYKRAALKRAISAFWIAALLLMLLILDVLIRA